MRKSNTLQLIREISATEADYSANLEMYSYGTPIEYIVGYKFIADKKFFVDRRVYIPNSESEAVVDIVAEHLPNNGSIIDVGTGCGWIGILLKKRFENATITATDIESGALEVAQANADFHNVDITFRRSCLLSGLELGTSPDIIVADLPYGDARHALKQDDGFAHDHLPATSTFPKGGVLSLYRRLIENVMLLQMDSTMICEIGYVEDDIVFSELSDKNYDLRVERTDGFGFAVLTKTC